MKEKDNFKSLLAQLTVAADEMVKKGGLIKLPNGKYKATDKFPKPTESEWNRYLDLQSERKPDTTH